MNNWSAFHVGSLNSQPAVRALIFDAASFASPSPVTSTVVHRSSLARSEQAANEQIGLARLVERHRNASTDGSGPGVSVRNAGAIVVTALNRANDALDIIVADFWHIGNEFTTRKDASTECPEIPVDPNF